MTLATIPLLPNSIAASLNPDLASYLAELKFLLLFFERPHAILSTSGLDFLNNEVVDQVRSGRQPRTNLFEDEQNLHPLEVLLTEEWEEALSHCEVHNFNIKTAEGGRSVSGGNVSDDQIDEILRVTKEGLDLKSDDVYRLFCLEGTRLSERERLAIQYEFVVRLEMRRLLDLLERCSKRNVPMIWSHVAELHVSDIYAKYLLLQSGEGRGIKAALRKIKGGKLLKEVFELNVVNVSTVSVDKIATFRRNNQDLLNSFLTNYRGFLAELQANPRDVDRIVEIHTQRIVESLAAIDKEVSLLRSRRGYTWLRRLAEGEYEAAAKGLSVGVWSFFAPHILLAAVVKAVSHLGRAALKDVMEAEEMKRALLVRSSTGYLWKARHGL